MNFDLAKSTILLVLSGSRAYGINTETSDWDYRGICIPPLDSYIGLNNKFEQVVDKEAWKKYPEGMVHAEADMQVMELSKFCRLAADNNPSIIEILFSDESDIIYHHPIVRKLLDHRNIFLSKRIKARFSGYAYSQLNRIKRHKRWLDNPPSKKPIREDFGLPSSGLISTDQIGAAEALIKREVDSFVIDQTDLPEHTKIDLTNGLDRMMKAVWESLHGKNYPIGTDGKFKNMEEVLSETAMHQTGYSDNFIEILRKERLYRNACQEWNSYQTWLTERNLARAELERKFGYDTKHAAHLYRLLIMSREILETGKVIVKRPDAEKLKAIRNGVLSYEEICDFAEKENLELEILVKKSKLPNSPPMDIIHNLVYDMICDFNNVSAPGHA